MEDSKNNTQMTSTSEDTQQWLDEAEATLGQLQQDKKSTDSHDSFEKIHGQVLQYVAEGRYEEVPLLCEEAVAQLEMIYGHDHPNVATILNTLALVHCDQCNYKEAERLLAEVLAIREKTLGNHPDVVATLNDLSVLHEVCANYQKAELFYFKAIDMRERLVGEYHPDVALQIQDLALLYQNQMLYEEAEFCYKRAMEIYVSSLGPESSYVEVARNNLAKCYLMQDRFKDAEILYKQELTRIHEISFGPIDQHNKPIWQIAEERQVARGKKHDNTPYNMYGSWHNVIMVQSSTVPATLRHLAELYYRQGKQEAARTLENCAARAMQATSSIKAT
ncbi:kinesin light chain-like [Sabethes cyaneus]|uniref:kinesin light chain-like n=1 Tax=Sabethes cyaneus TaxID=53552 RepID=UPI00237D76FD|nr:kinesin light chain-like [Sabethes cyaneus]